MSRSSQASQQKCKREVWSFLRQLIKAKQRHITPKPGNTDFFDQFQRARLFWTRFLHNKTAKRTISGEQQLLFVWKNLDRKRHLFRSKWSLIRRQFLVRSHILAVSFALRYKLTVTMNKDIRGYTQNLSYCFRIGDKSKSRFIFRKVS